MRCQKARTLIALSASGDVSAAESLRVADHVARCPACRELAAADPLPFASLRTSVPLRDDAYAAVRARVRADLASEGRAPFLTPIRLAMAAVLAVLLGIGAFLVNRAALEGPATLEIVEAAPPSAVVEPFAAVFPPAPPEVALPSDANAAPSMTPSIPRVARARAAAAQPETSVAALETLEELRIQIQTNDPGIRIIWIVNPSHESEPTSLEEKS